jgi:hypothetical protein
MPGGFADFYGQTNVHPLALAVVLALMLTTFALSRRYVFAPLVVAASTLPMSQRLVLAGADLTLMRILLLAYVLRILFRGENRDLRWNKVDSAVVLWTLAGTIILTAHYGTSSAFINRLGWSFDILVTYFTARCVLRNFDDVLALAKIIAIASLPIAMFFQIEATTHRNLFSVFGGVPAETVMREGKFRCQGAFAHPILAGTFWAATLPLIWMLWKRNPSDHRWAIIGTISTIVIIIACSSSTPILTAALAGFGLWLFRYRHARKKMWVGLCLTLLTLHLVMEAPVWHLMARVDLVGGSTGWHRYIIFDAFINHFSSWWATGDSNPKGWGVWQMRDITNQYMLEGLRGGLLTLTFFVLILLFAFGKIGRAMKALEELPTKNIYAEKLVWLIGVTILLHTVTFFGVSYFGQITALLYIHFALAGAVASQLVPNFLKDPGQLITADIGTPPDDKTRRRRRAARPA